MKKNTLLTLCFFIAGCFELCAMPPMERAPRAESPDEQEGARNPEEGGRRQADAVAVNQAEEQQRGENIGVRLILSTLTH